MSKYLEWLDYGLDVAKIALSGTPAGAIVAIVDEVVENSQDSISNDSIVKTLESMAKSKGNDLTPGKIQRLKFVLGTKSKFYKHDFSGEIVEALAISEERNSVCFFNAAESDTFIVSHTDFLDLYTKVD